MKKSIKYISAISALMSIIIIGTSMKPLHYDSACKKLSDERLDELVKNIEPYYQQDPENSLKALVELKFDGKLNHDAELIIFSGGGAEGIYAVPYRGNATEYVELSFLKPKKEDFFYSSVSVKILDRKNKSICTWVNEHGIRLPNLNGSNRFLFKMRHPNDGYMNTFEIIHR